MICNKKSAFTLAEVLITLGIIGVVAALTLPSVINNIQDKQMKVAWKKVFSELSQANEQLNNEYGGTYTTECSDFNDKCLRALYATKLNVLKMCDAPIADGCQVKSQFLDGADTHFTGINSDWPGLLTNSGYSIKFRFHANGCSPYTAAYKGLSC